MIFYDRKVTAVIWGILKLHPVVSFTTSLASGLCWQHNRFDSWQATMVTGSLASLVPITTIDNSFYSHTLLFLLIFDRLEQ